MAQPLTSDSMNQVMRIVAEKIRRGAAQVRLGAPDTIHEPSGLPMGEIMAIHEYGEVRGEARAPFAKTMNQNKREYIQGLKRAASKAVQNRDYSGYEQLGAKAVADVQESISNGLSPENAKSTVARKGSSTPLIDKGVMRQAIGYDVKR